MTITHRRTCLHMSTHKAQNTSKHKQRWGKNLCNVQERAQILELELSSV